jgi:SGNH hydrolase-like domain, acetyltransferase AlgX
MNAVTRTRERLMPGIVLVVVFNLLLILGMAGSFLKRDSMPDFRENRVLASLPSPAAIKSYNEWPAAISSFIADNFGFRKRLMSAYFWFRLRVLRSDVGLPVKIGVTDWLLFDDELVSYRQQAVFTEEQRERIRKNLDAWSEYARRNGAIFILVVGPNKSTIYEEEVPEYLAKDRRNQSLFDQVYGIRFQSDFVRVDLRPALKAHRGELLYYKWGTHWNDRASQIAWECIKKQASTKWPQLAWDDITTKLEYRPAVPLEDSLWQWFGLQDPYSVMLPVASGVLESKSVRAGDERNVKPRLIAFGDSFLQFMFRSSQVLFPKVSVWMQGTEDFRYEAKDLNSDAWLIKCNPSQYGAECGKSFKQNIVMFEVVERNIWQLMDLPVPPAASP